MTQAIARPDLETKPDNSLSIDTLIISVGTRQIGWLCDDGVVRCFGVDGEKGDPSHTQQLYNLLDKNIQRDFHDPNDPDSKWKVRDLGERYYKYALKKSNFDRVELLMDEKIIHDYAIKGMKHIILWATNQPEITTPWRFRRDDTVWLAKLMERKIESLKQQHKWNNLEISIVAPVVNAGKSNKVSQIFATEILPLATKNATNLSTENNFVLGIENTGCVPTISESLAISTAALIRQFSVINVKPIVPKPMYQGDRGMRTAIKCSEYTEVLVSDYFWSLEKTKIVSAWKRGDFNEARIWLTPHQHKYEGLLYQLAEKLTLCNNGEFRKFIFEGKLGIQSWLKNYKGSHVADQNSWNDWLKEKRKNRSEFIYEQSFLIYVFLTRNNYTNAFRVFSQIVEKLLYQQYVENNWLSEGIITIPKRNEQYRNNYNPPFTDLIDGWLSVQSFDRADHKKYDRVLHGIRKLRNSTIHDATPILPKKICNLWSNSKLDCFNHIKDSHDNLSIYEGMEIILKWIYPKKGGTLCRYLYEWGLETLKRD